MSYRKYQALFDLQAAANHLFEKLQRDISPGENAIHEKIHANMNVRVANWKLGITDNLWRALTDISCSPEEDIDEFLLSTCLLVLDRFENPERGGDFMWEWDAFSDHYRNAAAPIRSALMNGLEQARQLGRVSENIKPSRSDRTTTSQSKIIEPLIRIARALTPQEKKVISLNDYGQDAEKHLSALNAVLASKSCRFTDSWYPAEPVELVSHVPGTQGFVGCTALVLLNAVYNEDHVDNGAFRWRSNKLAYLDMDNDARNCFLVAFRHLYETSVEWDPFYDTFAPERLSKDSFIPWDVTSLPYQNNTILL